VNRILIAVAWTLVGAAAGWFLRWGSVKLARLEDLEPGSKAWQVYGPPIMSAAIFAIFGYTFATAPLALGLRSLFALVLVQVVFFDLEHRLILDRVMFPSMALALLVSLTNKPWWLGIATGLGAGLLFLLLSLLGAAIFKAEALGFGDVKLAAFMGLLLGWPAIFQALFYGVLLAGIVAIGVVVWTRSMKGTIAYGPYLAVGALISLYLLP
jgi:leader peptidase (prepilin peptidase)/N-methyltransferase